MTFYGLTFASATLKLTGDPYLNFTLTVAVGFVTALIAMTLIDKLGRRPFMIATQFFSGVCVLICGGMITIPVGHKNTPLLRNYFMKYHLTLISSFY